MDIQKDLDELIKLAEEKGAVVAKALPVEKVVTDERTLYKCMYGCPRYMAAWVCPPYTPGPAEFEKSLRKYRWAVLVKTQPKDINTMVVEVERQAFLQGHYLALGLKGGPCLLCPECTVPDEPCCNLAQARPSMEALGIDVFATLENAGVESKVLTSKEKGFFFHGLILVE